MGVGALASGNGSLNAAVGADAGAAITGNGNVAIGAGMLGQAGVDNRTWIANVYDDVATDRIVYADADGHLGTLSSSRRYKEEITSMNEASDPLFALRPVTFRYKKDVDPRQARSFGLIAEEVAEVSPDLISCDQVENRKLSATMQSTRCYSTSFSKSTRRCNNSKSKLMRLLRN